MTDEKGILYGVGVGPGDPELLTLQAVRILREADILVLSGKDRADCSAYQIAVQALPELAEKETVCRKVPMTGDESVLAAVYAELAGTVAAQLAAGKTAAFLTIGDPDIYSSFHSLRLQMEKRGCRVRAVCGIPSFCAAAASAGISIADHAQQIHVIPGGTAPEETAGLSGTRIFMKSGKKLEILREYLIKEAAERRSEVVCISNCGMPQEHIVKGAGNIDPSSGYMTLVIVKDA